MEIKSRFDHFNINVTNLDRSIAFYDKALGLRETGRKEAPDGGFTLVYLGDGQSPFRLELTWLRDHAAAPYELGAEVLLADLRILTVSTSTSYLGQVRMHDPVRVTTTCERVGTKSLTLFQQLLAGGEVRSESRSVMVVLDFARQRSEPVPDAWRERLLAD